jgi:hypothetical protein
MYRVINRWGIAVVLLAVVLPLLGLWLRMAAAQTRAEAERDLAEKADRAKAEEPRAPGAMMQSMTKRPAGKAAMGMGAGMANMMRGMGSMMKGAPIDPVLQAEQEALAEQESERQRLISEYSQTEDEKERGWIAGEMEKVIARHFDIRQESRDRELKRLEEQVRKLREVHQKRARQKEQIVQDRVRQLLRDADGLGWGGEPGEPRPDPLAGSSDAWNLPDLPAVKAPPSALVPADNVPRKQ